MEGRQAVRELLLAGRRRVRQVMISSDTSGGPLEEIAELAAAAGVPMRRVSREELSARAGTETPQGVLAMAEAVREWTLEELLTEGPGEGPPLVVFLDGVTDPHNLGAVMRSALSAGATGVVVGRHRSASLSPAAVKAAAGAVEHLPVARVSGLPSALAEARRMGLWTVGLTAEGDIDLWTLELAAQPLAVVLGAEGRGLSPLTRERCELLVSIPMVGPLGSLNVSAAAAVVLFEIARRRNL